MKTLLLLFSLLIAFDSTGQEFELLGKYSASFIGAETIEFKGRDSFYFSGFYCTNGVHGKGRCEIRDGYLFLYFEKVKKQKLPKDSIKSPIFVSRPYTGGKAVVKVRLTDYSNRILEQATVILKSPGKEAIGCITNLSGNASFTVDRSFFPAEIIASCLGFESCSIKLDSAKNYEVTISLKENLSFPDEELNDGQIYVYEIGELYDDAIELRRRNSPGPYRLYQKHQN